METRKLTFMLSIKKYSLLGITKSTVCTKVIIQYTLLILDSSIFEGIVGFGVLLQVHILSSN